MKGRGGWRRAGVFRASHWVFPTRGPWVPGGPAATQPWWRDLWLLRPSRGSPYPALGRGLLVGKHWCARHEMTPSLSRRRCQRRADRRAFAHCPPSWQQRVWLRARLLAQGRAVPLSTAEPRLPHLLNGNSGSAEALQGRRGSPGQERSRALVWAHGKGSGNSPAAWAPGPARAVCTHISSQNSHRAPVWTREPFQKQGVRSEVESLGLTPP